MNHRLTSLALFFLVCIAVVMGGLATRWGIGTSPDSVAYIQSARTLWQPTPETALALVFRPPFYPFLLALLSVGGQIDPFIVARWLNLGLLASNMLLLGLMSWRAYPALRWLPPLLCLLYVVALPLLEIHAHAWTEPLFILLGFAAFALLAHSPQRPSAWRFTAVALLLALTLLTRYAGLAFIGTAALGVLWWSRPLWLGIGRAFLLGLAACLPLALWMGYNIGQGESATGRSVAFHPVGMGHVWQALFTVSDWVLLPPATPGWARVLGLAVVAATAVGLIGYGWRTRPSWPPLSPFYHLVGLFIPVYCLFLLVSISFLDAATPLDGRILSPIYMAALFLAAPFVASWWPVTTASPVWRALPVGVMLLFVLGSSLKTGRWLQLATNQGLGFSSVMLQQAPIMAHIQQLPATLTLYSNSPDAVYMVAGRAARPLPRKIEGTTQLPNPHYPGQWQQLGQELAQAEAVVIYFSWLGYNSAIPATEELVQSFSLQPLVETAEGTIYMVATNP